MTIDIDELREAVQTFGSQAINEDDLNELLDRLEAAEKELAELRSSMKFRTSLIGRTEAERDALRAKIEAMERQGPGFRERCTPSAPTGCSNRFPLYALPGAQGETK